MKQLILTLIPLTLCAGDIQLAWDPSPDTGVQAYILYASTNNFQTVATNVNVGTNLTAKIIDLPPGTWYFAATALGTNQLESSYSNFVIADVHNPPNNLRVVVLQYSTTITNFTDAGFFKVRIEP